MIPFNIPCFTGDEARYIQQAQRFGRLAGDGEFTRRCEERVKELYGFTSALFTNSGTAALEMAAMLCNFLPGDEVIMPSFTHVSTANAFIRAGAIVRFADSLYEHPNLDPEMVASMIGPKTKAIVIVHYGGVACDPASFKKISERHRLILIEDAAHCIGAAFQDQWLGSFGDFAAFSFHETKNIHCGHGGMLVINREDMKEAALEILHHGTDRVKFEKGEIPFYQWVRTGSAFLMPELNAAFLYPQLKSVSEINARRLNLWKRYEEELKPMEVFNKFLISPISKTHQHNGHIFFLLMKSQQMRIELIDYLADKGIQSVFHYMPLHNSKFAQNNLQIQHLRNAEDISARLLRLPLYDSLSETEVSEISDAICEWVKM
ncbi:MAG: dTDP-4-amino-4,6-dideoxygalactose transaminase [Flavitalea sp.]